MSVALSLLNKETAKWHGTNRLLLAVPRPPSEDVIQVTQSINLVTLTMIEDYEKMFEVTYLYSPPPSPLNLVAEP